MENLQQLNNDLEQWRKSLESFRSDSVKLATKLKDMQENDEISLPVEDFAEKTMMCLESAKEADNILLSVEELLYDKYEETTEAPEEPAAPAAP